MPPVPAANTQYLARERGCGAKDLAVAAQTSLILVILSVLIFSPSVLAASHPASSLWTPSES